MAHSVRQKIFFFSALRSALCALLMILSAGCATLFGWDIHAPGVLSQPFYSQVEPVPARVALYLDSETVNAVSKDRGGRLADPQTYYVGEAFAPILLEAFQQAFEEFVLIESEPTSEILKKYNIPYLVHVKIENFHNKVTLKGQAIEIRTVIDLYDQEMNRAAQFTATGVSDADKIFAKKGGPEVNLNSALENNARVTVQILQDHIKNTQ